ncbi:hypothetical protein RRG08_048331 [Elysia crispata]|uniref:Uncharacterized protein n=1 Tax=Elysia crispata TaxID=231223 RepID=A0AAE1E0V9_9GAST|nr:hypothetical protein RRG08_048331 [Elysia crispata]
MAEGGSNASVDEKQAIFHTAGNVASKHTDLSRTSTSSETSSDMQAFLTQLDRGGHTYLSDILFAFALLACSFFAQSSQRFCRNRLTSTLSPALLPEQAHVHPLPSASAGTGSRPPSPSFQTFSHLNHVIPMAATQRAANILMKRFCLQTDQEGNSKYNKKITKLV